MDLRNTGFVLLFAVIRVILSPNLELDHELD